MIYLTIPAMNPNPIRVEDGHEEVAHVFSRNNAIFSPNCHEGTKLRLVDDSVR